MPTKRTSLLSTREINRILNAVLRYDFDIQAIEVGPEHITVFLKDVSERVLSKHEMIETAYDEWKASRS